MDSLSNIRRLVDASAPYWAGEAEVVRTYWTSPVRTASTDLLWLSRQCFKEFWGSGASRRSARRRSTRRATSGA